MEKDRQQALIGLLLDAAIGKDHLLLFFAGNRVPRSNCVSYGHDVEDVWLLHGAAGIRGDDALLQQVKDRSVLLK